MFALPRRQPRQRIAVGSSVRLSQLHLGSSQLGLNALQCDASDGVICGRASLQRRLRGQSRKLSLPVMSRTEAESIEIGGGLANLGGGLADLGGVGDLDQDGQRSFTVGSPLHFRRRSPPAAPAPAARLSDAVGGAGSPPEPSGDSRAEVKDEAPAATGGAEAESPVAGGEAEEGAGFEGEEGGAEASSAEAEEGAAAGATAQEPQARPTTDPVDPNINKKVFAGNLPFTASKSRLWDLFEQFGKVANVHIVRNPHTGKPRGFGFITFKEDAGAQNALAANGSQALHLFDRQVRVSPAEPRPASTRSRAGRAAAARRPFVPTGPCHTDRLPAELLQLLLSFLSLREQLAAQRVSRRWRDAARDLLRRRHLLDLRAFLAPGEFGRLTDGTLRYLLRLMPMLRVLRTGGNTKSCSYKALDIVATHCKHLVEIELDGFCIDEDTLKKLCISCPRLEEVKLPSHYHFSEASVWVLLRHLPSLRTLDLNSSDRVTGRCFSLLPDSVRRLSVAGCAGLRSDSLRQVGARCPQLRQLDVSAVPELRAADLAAALAGCTQLERLTARRLTEPPEQYLPAAGVPSLKHMDVGSSEGVTDSTLRQLPDLLPGLHTLNIQGCFSVTEDGLYHMRRWKHLLSLDLSYLRPVTDAVLDKLHGLQLKQLHLAEGFAGPASFTSEALTRLVIGCPSLTLLDLSCVEELSPDLVDHLFRQLPATREVTLYVGGTLLQELPPPPAGPLRLQDVNTVPLHMRGMVGDMLWGADDDDYVTDEDDFYDFADGDFVDFEDQIHGYLYDYGYDDFDEYDDHVLL